MWEALPSLLLPAAGARRSQWRVLLRFMSEALRASLSIRTLAGFALGGNIFPEKGGEPLSPASVSCCIKGDLPLTPRQGHHSGHFPGLSSPLWSPSP